MANRDLVERKQGTNEKGRDLKTAALAIPNARFAYLSLPDFCFESFFSEDGCTGGLENGFGPDRGG